MNDKIPHQMTRLDFSPKELEALLCLDSKITEVMVTIEEAKAMVVSSLRNSSAKAGAPTRAGGSAGFDAGSIGAYVTRLERRAFDSIFGEPSAAWPCGAKEDCHWLAGHAIRAIFCSEEASRPELAALLSLLRGAPGEWLAVSFGGSFLDQTISISRRIAIIICDSATSGFDDSDAQIHESQS